MGLRVIIVGAGIAGLCAAIALRRAGHTVEIFEKSKFATEIGAALAVTPNGARVLANLGFSFERARACRIQTWHSLLGGDLKRVGIIDLSMAEQAFGASAWAVHRIDLHSELFRLATEGEINGSPPAILRLHSRVVDASPKGSITLSDGSTHYGDLVIAADGLHSVVRDRVLPKGNKSPFPSGHSAFRFLIDTNDLREDGQLAALLETKDPNDAAILIDASDEATERHMMWYPCRNGETQNFVGVHPTRMEDFSKQKDDDMKHEMLKEFSHFDRGIIRTIEKASHVKCWPLYVHNPISKWYKGRIVLIGDAAHPMLPFGGQGSNQAIEDAAAIGYMFSGLSGLSDLSAISKRLSLFEQARQKRAARVQILSKTRMGREKEVEAELKGYADPPGSAIPVNPAQRTMHDYRFDVYAECENVLRGTEAKYLEFQHWEMNGGRA